MRNGSIFTVPTCFNGAPTPSPSVYASPIPSGVTNVELLDDSGDVRFVKVNCNEGVSETVILDFRIGGDSFSF